MALTGIHMVSLSRRNELEWVAMMKVTGDEAPASYAGREIVESFGPPRLAGRMFQDSDLRPELVSEHRGSARFVLEGVECGRAGRFTVDAQGRFPDFHGGHGFRSTRRLEWFTDAALRRGIGWYFEQRYRHEGRQIGRFHVLRICRPSGVEVQKRPA